MKTLFIKMKNWLYSFLDSIKVPVASVKYAVIEGCYSNHYRQVSYNKSKAAALFYPAPVVECIIVERGLFHSWVVTNLICSPRLVSNKYIFTDKQQALNCADKLGNTIKPLTLDTMYKKEEDIPFITDEEQKEIEKLEKKIEKKLKKYPVRKSKVVEKKKKQPAKKKTTTKK